MDIDAKTALVIHYSTAKVHMLSALLKPFSLNVVHATTADEAKRLFRSLRPELTIIGLIEDWIPLLDVLRSGSSHVGVIVLTESDGLAASVRNMGFENVLIEQDPETVVEGIHCFLGDWFATSAPAPMKGVTVLIVDDEEEFRSSLSVDLAMRGYTVALAETGKVALDVLERHPSISVVLLDLVMPEMGGIDTLKELKIRHRDIGVILMTDFVDREIVRQALKLGAFDVILKPIDLNQLESDISASMASAEFRKTPWWRRHVAGSRA